jgi:hypothetical protein
MAVIGARPATGPWFLGGGRIRPRTRPAPARRGGHRRRTQRAGGRTDVRPLLVIIAVAAALALFYLSQSTRVAATGYEIDSLQATLNAARAEQQQLVTSIGQARSPAEIARRAARDLHLVKLGDEVVTFAPKPDVPAD